MQLAILIVLIIIAVVLAPWLLGVAAFLIAAYGVWLLVAAVVTFVALFVVVLVLSPAKLFKRPLTFEDEVRARNKEFNRKYMEEAEKERRAREEDEAVKKQS